MVRLIGQISDFFDDLPKGLPLVIVLVTFMGVMVYAGDQRATEHDRMALPYISAAEYQPLAGCPRAWDGSRWFLRACTQDHYLILSDEFRQKYRLPYFGCRGCNLQWQRIGPHAVLLACSSELNGWCEVKDYKMNAFSHNTIQ